jgi:hypothetical protein
MNQWHSSDAWLLQTLLMTCGEAGSSATMRSVIATGDYINHSIFSLEEILHGSASLIAMDFLVFENGKFQLTPIFHNEIAQLKKRPKSPIKSMQLLDTWLRTKSISLQKMEHALGDLKKEELEKHFTAALNEYTAPRD